MPTCVYYFFATPPGNRRVWISISRLPQGSNVCGLFFAAAPGIERVWIIFSRRAQGSDVCGLFFAVAPRRGRVCIIFAAVSYPVSYSVRSPCK